MDQLTYQEEKWAEVGEEIARLAAAQFPECDVTRGNFPFELDNQALMNLENAGMLHVFTARNPEIVGYVVNVVTPRHMLFQAKNAAHIGWYVAKEYRGKYVGFNLLKEVEASLRERGVAIMFGSHTINLDASPIFKKLGWEQVEFNYSKVIDGN